MGDANEAQKDVLAVKARFVAAKTGVSGLAVGFINMYNATSLGYYSLTVAGSEFKEYNLKNSVKNFVSDIQSFSTKYSLNSELNSKIRETLRTNSTVDKITTLISQIQSKDMGMAEHFFKNVLCSALSTDDVKIFIVVDMVTTGDFDDVRVSDEVESIPVADKVKLILPYTAQNAQLAEKIVRDKLQDIAVLKFKVSSGQKSGNGIVLFSTLIKQNIAVILAASDTKSLYELPLDRNLSDFYYTIVSLVSSQKSDSAMVALMDKAVKSVTPDAFAKTFEANSIPALDELLLSAFKAMDASDVHIESGFSLLNSVYLERLLNPQKIVKDEAPKAEKTESKTKGKKTIEVSLVLAPSRGKKLSELKRGESVQILLNDKTMEGRKLINSFKLMEGERIKPIGAPIYAVSQNPKEGFTVYVKITDELFGKTVEEEDIRVKSGDPYIEKEMKKTGNLMLLGVVAGVAVIVVVCVLLFSK